MRSSSEVKHAESQVPITSRQFASDDLAADTAFVRLLSRQDTPLCACELLGEPGVGQHPSMLPATALQGGSPSTGPPWSRTARERPDLTMAEGRAVWMGAEGRAVWMGAEGWALRDGR